MTRVFMYIQETKREKKNFDYYYCKSVSYTHLDVYKRQVLVMLQETLYMTKGSSLQPVSYTHLDVYKRQALQSTDNQKPLWEE